MVVFRSISPACADTSVVAALFPTLRFGDYHDDGIFSLLRLLPPPPNTADDIEQVPSQDRIAIEGNLEKINGDSIRFDQTFRSLTSRWRLFTPAS